MPFGAATDVSCGATGRPSSVTNTLTAAEFAEFSIAPVTSVLLKRPVTNEGVISSEVPAPFDVLMSVSSIITGVAVPGCRAPAGGEVGVLAVFIVHCVDVIV